MNHWVLTPAYGRDYKSKGAVLADWNSGKDFVLNHLGWSTYANRQSAEDEDIHTVNIRYKWLTMVGVFKWRDGTWK